MSFEGSLMRNRVAVFCLLGIAALFAAPAAAAEWAPGVYYPTGTLVTYQGPTYRCIQGHTSQVGWQPPATPALWTPQTSATATATVRPTTRPTARPTTRPTMRATLRPTTRPRVPATATVTARPTASPTAAYTPTPTSPSQVAPWAPNTFYPVSAVVTYAGFTYRCLQAHTSMVGREPPNIPALWMRYEGPTLNVGPFPAVVGVGKPTTVTASLNGFTGTVNWQIVVKDTSTGQTQSTSSPIFTPHHYDPASSAATSLNWTFTAARPGSVVFEVQVHGQAFQPSCLCYQPTTLTRASMITSSGAPILTVTQQGEVDCNNNFVQPIQMSWTNGGFAWCQYRLSFQPNNPDGSCCTAPYQVVGTFGSSTMSYTVTDKTKTGMYKVEGMCTGQPTMSASPGYGVFLAPLECP
jgi:hypothetical protein